VKRMLLKFDAKQIEAAVKQAEGGTTGEIVVQVVPRSDPYTTLTCIWAFVGFFFASVAAYFSWNMTLLGLLESQIMGVVLFAFLSQLPLLRRWTLPKKLAAARVHRECLAHFTALGLSQTRERTGILIYISLLEHRVEILADSGIHSKVGASYWDKQVAKIIKGIRESKPTEGLCEAIGEMGKQLSEHFPGRAHNPNELSDSVRLGTPDPKE